MWPMAPVTAKKSCIKMTPIVPPAGEMLCAYWGNTVATITARTDMDIIGLKEKKYCSVFARQEISKEKLSALDIVRAFTTGRIGREVFGALTTVSLAREGEEEGNDEVVMAKRKAKYSATTTLSAARAAAMSSGGVCRMSETATKLTAPPICLAHRAAAILLAPFTLDMGTSLKARKVPSMVPRDPIRNARRSCFEDLKTSFRFASRSKRGIAMGMR